MTMPVARVRAPWWRRLLARFRRLRPRSLCPLGLQRCAETKCIVGPTMCSMIVELHRITVETREDRARRGLPPLPPPTSIPGGGVPRSG